MKAKIDFYLYTLITFPWVLLLAALTFITLYLFTNIPAHVIEGVSALVILCGYSLTLMTCGFVKWFFSVWFNDFGIMVKHSYGNKMIAWEEIQSVRLILFGTIELIRIAGSNNTVIYMPRHLENTGELLAYLSAREGPDILFSNFLHGNYDFFDTITPEMLASQKKATDFCFDDYREDNV